MRPNSLQKVPTGDIYPAVSVDEILSQMDDSAASFGFPALDNGYIYPADVRLNAYRDAQNWLIIIETLGINPRAGGDGLFQNCLYVYGSNLKRAPGMANEDFLLPVREKPGQPIFDEEYGWFIRDDVTHIPIRENMVHLDLSPGTLASKGIEFMEPPKRDGTAVLRSLLPEHRDALLATEAELAERNPHGLPLFLRLNEWHHPNVISNERPSDSETFQMLARAIVLGQKQRYVPTLPPNTHWSNWPEGGTL